MSTEPREQRDVSPCTFSIDHLNQNLFIRILYPGNEPQIICFANQGLAHFELNVSEERANPLLNLHFYPQADALYAEMDEILASYCADVKYAVINLPMFLENLLYQTERLRGFVTDGDSAGLPSPRSFSFPLRRGTIFSYVTCKSLGELAAGILVDFDLLSGHMANESVRRRKVSITLRTTPK